MKKKVFGKIVFLVCLLFAILNAHGQEYNVQVSGHIFDLDSILPVNNHFVEIELEYGGFVDFYAVITDETGFYHLDTMTVTGPGMISATTFDCFGLPQQQQDSISPANNVFYFDFFICTDTTIGCTALFGYEIVPETYYDVMFFDLSLGNYEFWVWDFGDSTISNEANPIHHYDNSGLYNVCLTIMNNAGSCEDTYCAEVFVIEDTTYCQNWFTYMTNDNVNFEFNGFSIPEAQDYFWDFGDGSTGSGPIPSHTYSDDINDFIPVTLTTLHFNAVMGDSCIAFSQQLIFVGNMIPYVADFSFEQDSTNFLTYHFTDNSIGSINNYFWDFGDGTSSELQNPVHSFTGPGVYPVCLTIFCDSLGIYCTDTFCQDINIEFELITNFEFYLDTVSGVINQYVFIDVSVGEPESWLWDFGDGNYSDEQNPIHQFENSGEYEICLGITRNFSNGIIYSDSDCQSIETPNYFDLGGQVFIDNIPMNNFNGDTAVIDTGMALLYRKYSNFIVPVDTNIFYQYGYYWFINVREGDYLVKVQLTENSENYSKVLSSYHENSLFWIEANQIPVIENNYEVSVFLPPLLPNGLGPGTISGVISINGSKLTKDTGLLDMLVILLNENMEPVSFNFTNEYGQFNFENISLGNYYLYAESTGLFTSPFGVFLDDANPSMNNIVLELYEQAVLVPEQKIINFEMGYFYPNPVSDHLNLDIYVKKETVLKAYVYGITGNKIKEYNIILKKENQTWKVNVADFPKGIYIVTFMTDKSQIIQARKFIK